MKFKIISFNRIQNHNIRYNIIYFYKTPLYLAVENENIEIIKLLLSNDKLDTNLGYILNIFIYKMQNYIIQYKSKSYLSIKFKIISFNIIQNHIFQ